MSKIVRYIAEQLDVKLEPALCSAVLLDDGVPQIVVTLDHQTRNEEERSFLQSAFMCEVLEQISNAMVQVHVPAPLAPYNHPVKEQGEIMPRKTMGVNAWISMQAVGVHALAQDAAVLFSHASYTRVVETYPWRDKKAMLLTVNALRNEMLDQVKSGLPSPIMMGKPDQILRPLETILGDYDRLVLLDEIVKHKTTSPSNLLDAYEYIYDVVVTGKPHHQLLSYVFHQLLDVL